MTSSTSKSECLVVVRGHFATISARNSTSGEPPSFEDADKRAAMEDIALLLQGAIRARGQVLLKLNVAGSDLDAVLALLPAMASPTVTQLAQGEMQAVETVVAKRGVNTLIPALKSAGASDILELPISKI